MSSEETRPLLVWCDAPRGVCEAVEKCSICHSTNKDMAFRKLRNFLYPKKSLFLDSAFFSCPN